MSYPGNAKRFEIVKNTAPVFLAAGYKDRSDIAEGIVQVYLQKNNKRLMTSTGAVSNRTNGFCRVKKLEKR